MKDNCLKQHPPSSAKRMMKYTNFDWNEKTLSAMTDVHNPTTRSYNMSRIGAKDTKPELMVRKFYNSP